MKAKRIVIGPGNCGNCIGSTKPCPYCGSGYPDAKAPANSAREWDNYVAWCRERNERIAKQHCMPGCGLMSHHQGMCDFTKAPTPPTSANGHWIGCTLPFDHLGDCEVPAAEKVSKKHRHHIRIVK